MYTIAVSRDFTAQHFLVGVEWEPEHELHSHNYLAEMSLSGARLDENGYLVDMRILWENLDRVIDHFHGGVLNEFSEFEGVNPSIEHFSRVFCERFLDGFDVAKLERIAATIWEDDDAWASYEREL